MGREGHVVFIFSPAQRTRMHNWEMVVHFQVHGSGKTLFGDGFAIWYTKERAETGEEEGVWWVGRGRGAGVWRERCWVCGGGGERCWMCGGGGERCSVTVVAVIRVMYIV